VGKSPENKFTLVASHLRCGPFLSEEYLSGDDYPPWIGQAGGEKLGIVSNQSKLLRNHLICSNFEQSNPAPLLAVFGAWQDLSGFSKRLN
jgi:hypothetical protein